MKAIAESLESLDGIAKSLLGEFSAERIFVFVGTMGAGKTTFIQRICAQLGVEENMSSPTFSIVNEYQTKQGEKVYHFDMYRIEKLEEAVDMGFEEYLESGNYCFIEWPDKVEQLLPDKMVVVRLEVENELRNISADIVE